MRKVLSFVLVLSLVLGSFGMAFAAPLSDMAGEKSEDAVNVLTQLGVVSGYPDGTYKPENIVTRAEMAVIVVRALGLADYAVGGVSNFSDMGGHWSNPYVAYATSLGVIAGYPDGSFRPDNTVSYDEAATMLVAALGYNADSLVGTWPANFVVKAKSLGILDGIKAGAAGANRGDIAIMAFQTLGVDIGKVDKDGDWSPNGSDTMLSRLGARDYIGGAEFVLDETDLVASGVNVKAYYGANVTAYANSKNKIIAIKEVNSTFLTGDYNAADGTFETDDVDYNLSGTLAALPVTHFVNGLASGATTDVATDGTDVTIAADVSGKTIKDIYSVSEWNPNQNKKVVANDLKSIDADTPKLLGETFALDDNDEIDLVAFDLVGVSSLDEIEKDNIVYVYKNVDGISKIEVGTEVIEGEVTKIKGSSFTVDGTVYKFTDIAVYNNAMAAGTRPSVGHEIEAYLDAAGKIFFYDGLSGEADKYAVVLKTGDGTVGDGLNDTDTKIELFLSDGSNKVFTVDADEFDTLATAGVLKDDGSLDGTVDWAIVKGDVVMYDVNDDGEINDMAFVVDSSVTADVVVPADGAYIASEDLTKNGYFNGLAVASDAVIITYNTPFTDDEDDYGVATRASLLDSTIEGAWYIVDDNVIVFMYIDADSTSTTDVFGVYVDYATVSSTSPKYEVDLIVDGVETTYAMKANPSSKSASVLYKLSFALDGTTLDDITTLSATKGTDWDNLRETTTTDAVVSGQTVKGTMKIDGAGSGVPNTLISLDNDVVVYVFNKDGEFEVGDINDIEGIPNVLFYDFNDDKVYDVVVIAPKTMVGAAIGGVTAPVKDVAAVTTVTATSEYTATISWSPALTAGKFAADTVYTATITITPKAGYTLDGITANFFTVAGATATNAADSGVVTAVFPATGS